MTLSLPVAHYRVNLAIFVTGASEMTSKFHPFYPIISNKILDGPKYFTGYSVPTKYLHVNTYFLIAWQCLWSPLVGVLVVE